MLFEDLHYDISYSGTEHPGTVTVTATAKGNYQGTLTCTYEIMPYFVWEDSIRAEYTQTVYNGTVQKPVVTIGDLVEGKDYFVSYEKKVNGEYQAAEPKEAGEYRIVVRMSEDMAIMKEGISEEDALNVYYISYFIQDNGSGGSGTGDGSGTGGMGSTGGSGSGTSGTGGSGNSNGTGGSGSTTAITGGGEKETTGDSGALNAGSDTVKKLKLTAKKNAIKVSWSKLRTAKGYQIQISRYKNYRKAKTIHVKKSKKTYTFKKLKKNTKYYVRIRVNKGTVGTGKNKKKVYGKWTVQSIRIH